MSSILLLVLLSTVGAGLALNQPQTEQTCASSTLEGQLRQVNENLQSMDNKMENLADIRNSLEKGLTNLINIFEVIADKLPGQ